MASSPDIEERLTALEREMTEVKNRLASGRLNGDWIAGITGSFADDPDFDEILRLGREFRDSQPACDTDS